MTFVLSKLFWAVFKPETWLILLVGLSAWWVWRGEVALARFSAAVSFLLLLLVAIFPLGQFMIAQLERTHAAPPPLGEVKGIIILGGAEDMPPAFRWGGVRLNSGGERLTEGLRLARLHPEAVIVLTGGSGSVRGLKDGEKAESEIARRFFLEQGFEPSRLMVESRSRNTSENARFSHELVQPEDGETWVLVTSAFHMPRAMDSFRRAGWIDITAWPVDFRSGRFTSGIGWNFADNLSLMNVAAKEHAGLLAYRILDR